MLFDNDVMADGKAEPGALSCRLGCKERIENLILHLGRDTGAIITDADFHLVTTVSCCSTQGRLEVSTVRLDPALDCRVEAIGDQIQQNSCDVLWENVGLADGRVKRFLQFDIETPAFRREHRDKRD